MADTIPFLDLKGLRPDLKARMMEAVSGIIDDAKFIGGPWLEIFYR